MFLKLATLIVVFAGVASGLLAVRQQRLQAAHDMAEAMRRAAEMDRQLWRLRAEIAARTTPDEIQRRLNELPTMAPIEVDWCPPETIVKTDGEVVLP